MYTLIFVGLVPLIAFAIFESFFTAKQGVVAAFVTTSAMVILTYWYFGEIDLDTWLMLLFVLVMGLFTLKSNNPLFFKMQPCLSAFVSTLILAYYQYFDTPLMVKMLPKMETLMTAEQKEMLTSVDLVPYLTRATEYAMFWIVLHGVLMGLLARYASTKAWLLGKALFLPYFLVMVGLSEYIYRNIM